MSAYAQLIARMDDERDRLREWLLGLTRSTGMTLSAIAKEAEVSTTTITRFVNDAEYKFDLARRTIRKIEDRFATRAPVSSGLADNAASPFQPRKAPTSSSRPAPETVSISDDAMNLHGLQRGDACTVSTAIKPDSGDLVFAEINNSLHRREGVVRIYSPPYLLAHSTNFDLNRPLLIEPGRVAVVGVVTRIVRSFQHTG